MVFRPEEWARVKSVFDGARGLAIADRRAFVASACAGNAALEEHVEKLLAAHQLASSFLETPAVLSGDHSVTVSVDGQQIAGYELMAFIGAGGMGEVYKARDRNLDRPVALKLLPVHFTHDAERLRRFRAEARAASSLNHPHILVVHDFGEFNGRPFIVTEFVDGQTVRERINGDVIAVKDAVGITAQVASALAAAHGRGIVHRDIKPENVMLRPDGYVKVLDFGLARQVAADEAAGTKAATEPGMLVGTLRYMSPEQSRGQHALAPSDVFSLGLVLFEMITGRHPFQADSSIAVLHGIQSGTAPASGGGAELDDLLQQMLQKDAAARPPAADVASRLARFATRTPAVAYVSRQRASVGRERERADLRVAFEAADRGTGQFLTVSGEPGIGKSTLVDDFLSEIVTPAWIGRGRCSERLAGAEAHLPLLEALDSMLKRDPGVAAIMKQCAPGWYVQIAPVSPEESSAARLLADTRSGSAERLMREMAALLYELVQSRPVVLFLDDVHWADVSTIDLLGYLAPKLSHLRVLLLVTYRPTDLTVSRHPFLRLKADLSAHGALRDVAITFLSQADVAQYVSSQLQEAPADLAGLIYRKTEGSPLFMVDLVRYLREHSALADWAVEIERNVPESLRGMIERKLEGLDDPARQLLRVAAIQGFQFDSAIIAQVLERDPADVEDSLQSLDRVHGLVQLLREQEFPSRLFSLRYQFVHVLYQSALFASVSPSRKAAWSAKVAGALEAGYGERKATVAAELALLFEMARDPWRASEHFLAAAEVASSRFATREALAFARRGLACLSAAGDGVDIKRRELALQKALLVPLGVLEGYGSPATERVSQRIIELAEHLEDHGSLFAALDGACFVHMVRGECDAAARIADRMLAIADQSGNDVSQMNARMWAMIARHHLGDLFAAQRHADACIALGTPSNQAARLTSIFDPVVATLVESARNLWIMGDTRRSVERTSRAIELAREIRHPDSLSFALLFHGWIHGHREEWDTCLGSTAEAIAFCAEHGLVQTMAWNHCVHGWALAHTGKSADGLVELQSAIEDSVRIFGQVAMPQFLFMLAEVLILRGDHARALEEVERILSATNTSRDRYFNAELHRLAAECYLAFDEPEAAEAALQQAIATARAQGAKTFELRGATALARLWANRHEKARAQALLQSACATLGDAEETIDVQRARLCLSEWS
jgi:serine/threonine protein kinase/predicted ATPase